MLIITITILWSAEKGFDVRGGARCRAKATALHGHLKSKKAVLIAQDGLFEFNPGDDLRSHTVARAVSSARRGLTSVFGMGTGVTLAV
jgi:hypothetical protein